MIELLIGTTATPNAVTFGVNATNLLAILTVMDEKEFLRIEAEHKKWSEES